MRILIVHQYFNTPETGGPLRSFYLAEGLGRNGYEVEVISTHNASTTVTRQISGFKVHFLPVSYHNGMGFWARIFAFVKFARLALKKAMTLQPDLCYAMSTPLTVGWTALRLKARKNIPFIFEVGDLWPEAPIQMGVIKSTLLKKLLQNFERKIYKNACQVVALSPGIQEGILKVAPACRTAVIPNMSDCNYFGRYTEERRAREPKHAGKFLVLYCGAVGKANHLEFLVAAAKSAQRLNHNLYFIVAGKGSELERIKKLAAGLSNIEFLSYLTKAQLREVMEICDAVYVSYAAVQVLTTGSPNKFFDGLAGGKMMILNFGGWLKDLTLSENLGVVVDPEKPDTIVTALEPFIADPALLRQYQHNARCAGEKYFSREMLVQKLAGLIRNPESCTNEDSVYTLTA